MTIWILGLIAAVAVIALAAFMRGVKDNDGGDF